MADSCMPPSFGARIMGAMTSLAAVSVVTRDMGAAIDFYTRLGLSLTSGGADDDHCEFGGDGVRLMLDDEQLISKLDPTWQRATGGHAMALAFQCSSPGAVDTLVEALAAGGTTVRTQPWDAFWGQRYASVLDPDGNQVDLFCPL